jgi:GAF domain-containing protein
MAGLGWAFSTGRITGYEEITSVAPSLWLGITFELLMLSTFIVVSLNYLVPRLAAALAQSRNLAQELETQRAGLEEQVAERTRELEGANEQLQRHTTQLRASAEIGRAATSILDIDELYHTTVNLIHDEFGLYYAGVFLIDETGTWAVLRAASGEIGQQIKAQGHRLALDDHSMVGWVATHGQSRVVLDVRKETKHFDNTLLPHTRSEMTLPLMVGERLLGVLDVQSTEEAAFDEDDARTLRLMADQIAVAIDNAKKFSDEALLLEATSPIYRVSRRLTTATTTDEVTDAVIASVAETGADGCVVVEFEFSPAGELETLLYLGVWRRDREPQFRRGLRLPIAASPFPFEMVSTLWTVADVKQDGRLPQSARQVFETTDVRALANIPLHARENVFGQIVVLHTTPGPFPQSALRLYEMLSAHASVALERARLLEEAQRRAEHERLVSEITAKIRRPLDIDAILRTTMQELGTALGASEGLVRLGISDGADRK